MICDGCHYLERKHEIDEEGCVHISWRCTKRNINICYQIIRSDRFLQRLPMYKKIEVILRPNIDKCSVRMPKTSKLLDFFSENSQKMLVLEGQINEKGGDKHG